MSFSSPLFPVVIVSLPILGAIAALLPRWPAATARLGAVMTAVAGGMAVIGGVVAFTAPVPAGPADVFAVLVAGFVATLSAVVQGFAVRHLRADVRQRWFTGWVNVLTAGALLIALAPTVLWFGVGWSATGAALVLLLATYTPVAQARLGVRRSATAFMLGDAALWALILALVVGYGGDVRWSELAGSVAASAGAFPLLGALAVVTAGLSRSAQIPFHRWLPATVAASTPVSAIMHAGVVNAAAVLVIRFTPVLDAAPSAVLILFAAGALSALFGAAGMLVAPDLKSRLVASTTAQMGFMVMSLGAGAYAAALFHLIAHGWYKAELFLSSGSQIDARRAADLRPVADLLPASSRMLGTAISVAVPAVAILGTTLALGGSALSSVLLAAYGIATGAILLHPFLTRSASTRSRVVGVVGTALLGSAYALLVRAFERLIADELPVPLFTVPAWALLIPAILLLAISTLPILPARLLAPLWGALLAAGSAGIPRARIPRPALRRGWGLAR